MTNHEIIDWAQAKDIESQLYAAPADTDEMTVAATVNTFATVRRTIMFRVLQTALSDRLVQRRGLSSDDYHYIHALSDHIAEQWEVPSQLRPQ